MGAKIDEKTPNFLLWNSHFRPAQRSLGWDHFHFLQCSLITPQNNFCVRCFDLRSASPLQGSADIADQVLASMQVPRTYPGYLASPDRCFDLRSASPLQVSAGIADQVFATKLKK